MNSGAAIVAEEDVAVFEPETDAGCLQHPEERPEAETAAISGAALKQQACRVDFGVAGIAEGRQLLVWMDPQLSYLAVQQQP